MDVYKLGLTISILAWALAGQIRGAEIPIPTDNAHELELIDMKIQLIGSQLQTLYERFLRSPEAVALVAETTRVQNEYRTALIAAFTAADLDPATHSINIENMTFEPMNPQEGEVSMVEAPEVPDP